MELFEVTTYDKKIWEEELKDFLPEKILDIHTHVYCKRHIGTDVVNNPKTVTWPGLVAAEDPIEDLQETYRLMFPGKEVKALIFGTSCKYLDENNAYITECAQKTDWPALYFSRPEETADELEQKIRSGGFLGVKSYLTHAPEYIPGDEIRIFDFFPKHQLARLNEMGAICMLHIPRSGRLKDPVNIHQILEIRKQFPKLRLIVAHIGRAYTKEDVADAFDYLTQEPDTMYDFAANCCEYAITEAIRRCGTKHLIFGTDMPILRMRTRRIEENGTYINLVIPGMYGDVNQDSHLREIPMEEADTITFFAYEELLAFKRACQTLGLSKQDVEDIMYNNAMNLIEGAVRDIYGPGGITYGETN